MSKLLFTFIVIFNLNTFCSENQKEQSSLTFSDLDDDEKRIIMGAVLEYQEKHSKKNKQFFESLKRKIRLIIHAIQCTNDAKIHLENTEELDLAIMELILLDCRADDNLKKEIDAFIKDYEDEQLQSLSNIYGAEVIAKLFAKYDKDEEESSKQFFHLLDSQHLFSRLRKYEKKALLKFKKYLNV